MKASGKLFAVKDKVSHRTPRNRQEQGTVVGSSADPACAIPLVTDVDVPAALKKVRSSHYAQDDLGLDEVAERIMTDSDAFKVFKVHLNPLAHGYRGQSRGTVSRMCLLRYINLGLDRSHQRWTKEELRVSPCMMLLCFRSSS